jgi:putative flavoprotein involved in K+ transport
MTAVLDTLVVGAGQAGLATGYYVQRAGHTFALLEAADQVGGAWAQYYDSLQLFSPARFSALPGMAFPGDPKRYPTRDEVVAYLQNYAKQQQLPIITAARVATISHTPQYFTVETTDQRVFRARSLVAATGSFQRPVLPELPGQTTFQGRLIHSADYQHPEPFRNQRVVVVGAGNSAIQIAVELAQVAKVTLATRQPIAWMPQRLAGRDLHFWLWLTGLDRYSHDSLLGRWFSKRAGQTTPVLDTGRYQAAFATGQLERRPMFHGLYEQGVVWSNGQAEAFDSVIFATGYQPNVTYLEGLGVLDATGKPQHQYGLSTVIPGLAFVGLEYQRSYSSATLRGVGPDAAIIVRQISRFLRTAQADLFLKPRQLICC